MSAAFVGVGAGRVQARATAGCQRVLSKGPFWGRGGGCKDDEDSVHWEFQPRPGVGHYWEPALLPGVGGPGLSQGNHRLQIGKPEKCPDPVLSRADSVTPG